jgi:hypothetical protein
VKYARRSRPGISLAASLALCALFASIPAIAVPVIDTLPTIDTLRNRLELSSEQEATLRPIFERRFAELQASQSRLQTAATKQAKRDVLRDAKKAGDTFNKEVEGLLTPSQKHEWREIRKELREKARERIEEKRSE